MPKFLMSETIHSDRVYTARLGTTSVKHTNNENGKALKLIGESAYGLCAQGDMIEGIQTSSNLALQGTTDGYAIGGYVRTGYKTVTFDGLQATPGTGVIAVGDYVVTGTITAFGTALPSSLKVCKATSQASTQYKARVVSLGTAGTGAVGTTGLIDLF